MAADGSVVIKVKLDAAGVEGGLDKIKRKTQEVGAEAERSGSRAKRPLAETEAGAGKAATAFDRLKAKVKDAGSSFGGFGSSGKSGLDMITSAAKKAAAAFAAIKIGEAVKDFGKQALESYAKYEQMVGGIDKLFGTGPAQTLDEYAKSVGKSTKSVEAEFNKLSKASQTVQKNAQNAFKTAGMSANSYMESVTGFSAALINSLGGDTQKAANMADVAMRSISDNANTFGTDAQMLVETYQSLAKGNYAMLDNLKLGYGGTKTELERMMKDANAYAKQNKDIAKEVGVNGELQVNSFADIVAAIELMQRKQGIAGTTAREAATTIEGSVNTAKAAWENWVTELGKDDADISGRTEDLVDSVVTAAGNVIPRIGVILENLGTSITDELPRIGEMVQEAMADVDLEGGISSMLTGGADFGTTICEAIQGTDFSQAANDLLTGIGDAVGSVDWGSTLSGVLTTIYTAVADAMTGVAEYVQENGGTIILSVLDVAAQAAASIVSSLPSLLTAVGSVLNAVIDAVLEALGSLAAQALTAAGEVAGGIEQGFYDGLSGLADDVAEQVGAAVDSAMSFGSAMLTAGQNLATSIANGVTSTGSSIATQVGAAVDSAKAFASSVASGFASIGSDIVNGIISGVTSMAANLASTVASAAKGALDAAKSLLGIHSPSRVFRDEVGKQIAAGVIEGIEAMTPEVVAASAVMAGSVAAAAKSATAAAVSHLSTLGKKADKQLKATDKALDKTAKQMGKKAKAASEKQYGDVYKAAKNGLAKVKKSHDVSAKQEAAYWAAIGKKAKDGSALQEKCYAKMDKAAQKHAASLTLGGQRDYLEGYNATLAKQVEKSEAAYKAEEKHNKALKKAAAAAKSGSDEQKKLKKELEASNESLKAQDKRLDSQKSRLKDNKDALKDVRKEIKEAAKQAKDDFLGVEDTSTKSLKEIREELADTIADLQQKYQDAVQSTADSITGSLDVFKEFTSESTGSAETLIANMRSQAQATDDYKAVIEDLKEKVASGQISQTLFDELASKGIDSLADLKTVNSMTADQLKEYTDLFEKTRQDALNTSKTLNEDLYKETQDGIKKAQDKALDDAAASFANYEKTLKELGKKVSKAVQEQYDADTAAMQGMASTGMEKVTELANTYAQAFGGDILEQTKGYEQYTTSAMEAAAKAAEDAEKNISESVDTTTDTVKTGTTLITKTVETATKSQYAAIDSTMSAAESRVASAVASIKAMWASVPGGSGGGSVASYSIEGGMPVAVEMPAAAESVNWYAAGGIFNSPQVIGIGEQGTEFALRDYHLDAIAQRMGSSQQVDLDRAIGRLVNALPSIIKKSTPDSISINKREFGRLVREV